MLFVANKKQEQIKDSIIEIFRVIIELETNKSGYFANQKMMLCQNSVT